MAVTKECIIFFSNYIIHWLKLAIEFDEEILSLNMHQPLIFLYLIIGEREGVYMVDLDTYDMIT